MNTLLGFPEGGVPAFGRMLRQWRDARHMSQLTLATEAGISTRHLSFLETGRTQPSREMVLLLSRVLEVPLRSRNDLLTAAGYAPVYRETGLDAPEMAQVKQALGYMARPPALFVGELRCVTGHNLVDSRNRCQCRGRLCGS